MVYLLSVPGCNPKEDAPRGERSPAAPAETREVSDAGKSAAAILKGGGGYGTIEVMNPGALSVSVTYAGPIPEPAEVPVNFDVPFCGHKVFTENVLVDRETRGLRNVVVRLEGITKGKAPPSTVTVTNRNCAFEPHVAVAVKGMKIETRNADPVPHTTHSYLGGTSFFSVPLPAGSAPPPARPIPRAGLMELACDVHKWMKAYIVVHTNPYIEVSDPRGRLKIDGIPPGRYPFVAWHEQLGEKTGEVEISAGKPLELRLEFTAPK